ncbi:MAG: hypothetical protein PF508_09030 [Spirochaeta sp.]|jgi:hypothetical protein|nr:hypothetical protein [Spirochaeta sp.]
MGDNHGFWTKHDDWITVTKDHVTVILDAPERFGLTRTAIEEIYAAHGEKSGTKAEPGTM